MAAHGLQHQAALHPVPQLVQGLQPQVHHPLHGWLDQLQQAGAGQVLAQQHAEHGGLVRVLPGDLGEMGPGVAGAGGEEQLHIACGGPQGQDHLVPAWLIDLVDFCPGEGVLQFMDHSAQAQRVQRHGITSFMSQVGRVTATPPSWWRRAG